MVKNEHLPTFGSKSFPKSCSKTLTFALVYFLFVLLLDLTSDWVIFKWTAALCNRHFIMYGYNQIKSNILQNDVVCNDNNCQLQLWTDLCPVEPHCGFLKEDQDQVIWILYLVSAQINRIKGWKTWLLSSKLNQRSRSYVTNTTQRWANNFAIYFGRLTSIFKCIILWSLQNQSSFHYLYSIAWATGSIRYKIQ